MVAKMHSDIISISQLVSGFNKNHQIDQKEVVSRVKKLETSCHGGFSPQNESLRDRAIQTLETLKSCNLSTDAVQKVSETILSIQKAPHLPGPAQLAIFSDIDSPDWNSAIFGYMMDAAKSKVPFITSREMIIGKDFTDPNISRSATLVELKENLLKNHSEWNVFEHEGFLVFLPKDQTLESLDMKTDGTLKPISMLESLQGTPGKKDIHILKEMFSETPKRSKLIFIAGHGGMESTAAIKEKNYLPFLNFLNQQKCAGLTVTSCYSGGSSSLFYQPSEEIPKGVSFPVIVRSIGDFPSHSNQKAEENLKHYLDELALFVEGPTEATLQQAMKMLKGVEEGKWEKDAVNYAKIYFPHPPQSPGGFRPVGESNKTFSLTYAKLKGLEVGEKPISIKKGVEYIELHPLVIKAPMIIEEGNPVLLSMIPSQSHHLLNSIQLKNTTPEKFLKDIVVQHSIWELTLNKSFFISDLAPWKEVALSMSGDFSYCLYRDGDQYYYRNLKEYLQQPPIPLTPLQYALELNRIVKNSRASNDAVRTTTGGQETEAVFSEELQKQFPTLSKLSDIVNLTERKDLSEKEKESLVFYLMDMGRNDLALQFFKKENLSPNMKNLIGIPLICSAVKKGDLEFVKHLIEKNVDLNVDFIVSPLQVAIELGNEAIVSEFLQDKQLKVGTLDNRGWTPISAAVGKHPAIFEELKKRGASINTVSKRGYTPLSKAVFLNDTESIDELLKAKADPNLGNPSALKSAMLQGNLELLGRLIQEGGKVFEKNGSDEILFHEALKISDPEIIEYLLTLPDCKLEPEAIAAVIQSGNIKKIELIQNTGVKIPDDLKFSPTVSFALDSGINIFIALEEWKIVETLMKWIGTNPISAQIIGSLMIAKNPKKLEEYIRTGLIHPDSIFQQVAVAAEEDFGRYKDLLIACVEKGADVMAQPEFGSSPFAKAINNKNKDIYKILLKGVKDISIDTAGKLIEVGDIEIVKIIVGMGVDLKADPLFCKAVQTENLEIIEFFIQNGVDINPKTEGVYLPMEWAANAENPKILERLVELGGDLNRHGKARRASPFAILASKGNFDRIEWALQKGAEINPKNPQGETPLEAAGTNIATVKSLVELGAQWTETAAANVVQTGDLEFIRTSQQAGANIGTEKAYLAAVKTGNVEVLKMVRKAGGSIRPETITESQLLLEAYRAGGKNMFLEVLPLGGTLYPMERYNLWDLITIKGDMESFKAYLKHETDLQIPYGQAIRNNQLPMVLEVEKIDTSKTLKLSNDTFYYSIFTEELVDMMKHFFDQGFSADMEIYGNSLLIQAVTNSRPKALQLLLEMKVDPNQTIDENITLPPTPVLIYAIRKNDLPIVKELIEAGATISPDVITEANKMGNAEILLLLKDHSHG